MQKCVSFCFLLKPYFLSSTRQVWALWFMELREKCHEVGMLKEAGLSPMRCKNAWLRCMRLSSSFLDDCRCVLCMHKSKDRQKIKMTVKRWERKKRVGLTTLEECVGILVFCDQTSISASAELCSTDETYRKWVDQAMKYDDAGWKALCWFMRLAARHETQCWRGGGGGRVFVRTYLSVIYHTTTAPLTCELDTKHGSDEMDPIAAKCFQS